MSDPALLDLLEERGVKTLLIDALRYRLGLTGAPHLCDCADFPRAMNFHPPHGSKCSLWATGKALGLLEELVARDRATADRINGGIGNAEINHLVRGRRLSREHVANHLLESGHEEGRWMRREVERVMAAQQQLEERDAARAAEAQAIEDLKRHALINDPEVRANVLARAKDIADGSP